MAQQDPSAARIAEIVANMPSAISQDPLDEGREAEKWRAEQAKAKDIANARPRRIRDQRDRLKKAASDKFVDDWLAKHSSGEENTKSPHRKLPAQLDRDRVEGRYRFVRETLNEVLGHDVVRRSVGPISPEAEWDRHVRSLNLDIRKEISYRAESEGTQLTPEELNAAEALKNAHTRWTEGVHGPSRSEIDQHIETARQNGKWPLPELHTGDGSIERRGYYSYEEFVKSCNSPAREDNSRLGQAGISSAGYTKQEDAYLPPAHRQRPFISRLQSQLSPQFPGPQPQFSIGAPVPSGAECWANGSVARLPPQDKPRKRDRLKGILKWISRTMFGGKENRSPPPRAVSIAISTTEAGGDPTRLSTRRKVPWLTGSDVALPKHEEVAARGRTGSLEAYNSNQFSRAAVVTGLEAARTSVSDVKSSAANVRSASRALSREYGRVPHNRGYDERARDVYGR